MIITKIFTFDSAHYLENYKGKCKDMHGHTYTLHVSVKGEINNGMVIDFKDLKKIVKENVIEILDHKLLNDLIKQLTAENITIWIWNQLKDKLNLEEIKLYETNDSYVTYKGD